MKLFCLIPSYNESGNLRELSLRLIKVLTRNEINFKILYVLQQDKESLDILKKIQKKYSQVDYLYFPKALGVGKAYQIGFNLVKKPWTHVLTLDADLNHRPEELIYFLNKYHQTQSDIIIGSRFIPGGNFYDKRRWKIITSYVVNKAINLFFGIAILDKTSGYRLIKREVIDDIKQKVQEKGYPFYLEFILLAQKSHYSMVEVPINYIPRKWGKSKMGKFKTCFDYLLFFSRLLIFNF